ncbi:MAG: septum formation initiator family protein [Ekhidna sp.]
MKDFYRKIPSFFKSFYFLSAFFFLTWLAFIDSNDLFMQVELSSKRAELTAFKQLYEDRILEVKNDREALINNPDLLEKVAREKYLMKKKNEDLFIVVNNN